MMQLRNGLGCLLLASALVGVFLIGNVASQTDEKVFMCYWGSWSVYRQPPYTFNTSHIDVSMCTHLIYSFAGLNTRTNRIMSLDPTIELECGVCEVSPGTETRCGQLIEDPGTRCGRCNQGPGLYNQTVELKKLNPDLKVLIAIGGWGQGSLRFSNMANDSSLRAGFVSSAVSFIRTHGFDGLDLDWEYPVRGGCDDGHLVDRDNFVHLAKELREAFNDAQGDKHLYLTAAVASFSGTADVSYNASALSEHLDYFNIMAYDLRMYLQDTPNVGHHAALYHKEEEEGKIDMMLTVAYSVQNYLRSGALPHKLVIGIGAYGKTYFLKNPTDSFGDEAQSAGPAGVGGEPGTIFYSEICERGNEYKYFFDYDYFIPFAKRESLWVGYDDEDSVMEKVDYAEERGLGGMMIWSIDMDDFNNWCGGWYPNAIGNTIKMRMEYHAKRRNLQNS